MPDQFTYDPVTVFLFGMLLNSERDVTYSVSDDGLLDAFVKGLFGDADELHDGGTGIPQHECIGMIAMPAIEYNADVD